MVVSPLHQVSAKIYDETEPSEQQLLDIIQHGNSYSIQISRDKSVTSWGLVVIFYQLGIIYVDEILSGSPLQSSVTTNGNNLQLGDIIYQVADYHIPMTEATFRQLMNQPEVTLQVFRTASDP